MSLNIGELMGSIGLDVSAFEDGLDSAREKLSGFQAKGAQIAGLAGVGIAGALVAGLIGSMDTQQANAKLSAQLGLTGPESARLGKVAGSLYASNYGDSLEGVNEAVRSVIQNIGGMRDASSADLQDVSADVLALSSTFDQDLGGVTRAVGTMLRTGMAKDAKGALDIITVGFQNGANSADDLLDTFNEYSTQFRKLGLDGTTSLGLIRQGLQGGARDGDLVADAMKEFSIRAVDGSTTSAAGFKALGLNAQKMTAQIAKGGPAAQAGLDTVLDRLRGMKDPAAQSAAAVALFGTQAEDLGAALFAIDPSSAVQGLGQVAGAADRVNETVGNTASGNLESFKRQMQTAFVSTVGGKVLPVVSALASVLATGLGPAFSAIGGVVSGSVVPALQAVGGFIADHQTTFTIVAGIITAVFVPALIAMGVQATIAGVKTAAAWVLSQGAAVGALATQSLAVATTVGGWVLMGVQSMLQAARMAAAWFIALGPVGWVIAAIVGLVALVIANWDTVKKWTAAAWSWVWNYVKAIAGFLVNLFMNFTLPGLIMKHWDSIKRGTEAVWGAVLGFIKEIPGRLVQIFMNFTLPGLLIKYWSSIKTGAVDGFNAVVTFVSGIPGRLVSALGDLGNLLKDAGRKLIDGLLSGITEKFDAVKSKLGQLTDKLPDWKGPATRDAMILFGAGQLTIDGYVAGLTSRFGHVQDALGSLTATIPTATIPRPRLGAAGYSAASGSGGALAGAQVEITIHEAQQTTEIEVMRGISRAWSLLPQGV